MQCVCVCVWRLVGVEWEIIIIIILMIITLKGAIRDFLQSPRTVSTRTLKCPRHHIPGTIVCKSRATHRSLITYNMPCATCYEGTAQLLSLTELKLHLL